MESRGPSVTLVTLPPQEATNETEESATGKRPHESSPLMSTATDNSPLEPSPKKKKATDGSPISLTVASSAPNAAQPQSSASERERSLGSGVNERDSLVIRAAVSAASAAAEKASALVALPQTPTQSFSHSRLSVLSGVGQSPVVLSPGVATSPGVAISPRFAMSPVVAHSPGGVSMFPGVTGSPGMPLLSPGVALYPGSALDVHSVANVSHGGEEENRRARSRATEIAEAAALQEKQRIAAERARVMEEVRAKREWEKAEKKRLAQEAKEAEKERKAKEREEAKRIREEEKAQKKEEARIAREEAAKEKARVREEEKKRKALEKAKRQEEEKEKRAIEKAKKTEEEQRLKAEKKAAKAAEKQRLLDEAEKAKLEAEEQQKQQWNSWGFGKPRPEQLPPFESSIQTPADSPVKAVVLQRHLTGATVRAELSLKEIDRKAFDQAVRSGSADVCEEFRKKCQLLREARAKQTRKGSPLESLPRLSCMKLLAFHENSRPPYHGTVSRVPSDLRLRNPFSKASEVDYDVDSEEEWEEQAEDIEKSDGEEDLEEEDEEGDFFVPDDYLSDDERENSGLDGAVPSKSDALKSGVTTGAPKAIVDGISFSLPDGSPLKAYAVHLLPDVQVPPSFSSTKSSGTSGKELPEEQLRFLVSLLHNSLLSRPAIIAAFREKFPSTTKRAIKNTIGTVSTRASSRSAIQVNKSVLESLGMDTATTPPNSDNDSLSKKSISASEETTAVKKTIAKSSPAKRKKQARLVPLPKEAAAKQQSQLVIVLDGEEAAEASLTPKKSTASVSLGGVEKQARDQGLEATSGAVGLSAEQPKSERPIAILVPKKKKKKELRKVTPISVSSSSSPSSPSASGATPSISTFFSAPKNS